MDAIAALTSEIEAAALGVFSAAQQATTDFGVIDAEYNLVIQRFTEESAEVEPFKVPAGVWIPMVHLMGPYDFIATTANSLTGALTEDAVVYVTPEAAAAVYDPVTMERTGDPIPEVPIMDGVHDHGTGTSPGDGGGHSQHAGNGVHSHVGGPHAHDLPTPWWLRPLLPGDRVLVVWVQNRYPTVVGRVGDSRQFLEQAPTVRSGRTL